MVVIAVTSRDDALNPHVIDAPPEGGTQMDGGSVLRCVMTPR